MRGDGMGIFGKKHAADDPEVEPDHSTRIADHRYEAAPEDRAADWPAHLELLKAELEEDEPGWSVQFIPPGVAFMTAPDGAVVVITEVEYPVWELPEVAADGIRDKIDEARNAE